MRSKFFKVLILLSGILIILFGDSRAQASGEEWDWVFVRQGDWNVRLSHVQFFGEKKGLIAGDGMLLRTTDGGENWKAEQRPQFRGMSSVYFLSEREGWVLGEDAIYHTADGGKSWTRRSDVSVRGHNVYFVDSRHGWISATKGKILYTSDGGLSSKPNRPGVHRACILRTPGRAGG